ncbi:hypothetical protein [Oleiphilus sp. HI0132]|uniref:HzsA-related protein n=1 Tax=Oleiphilus sp. HI0132 TaxID=1822270 RepID=UPI001E4F8FDA|nr:hypothetical protein [Oleiphilus sp. HI0132]
MSLVAMISLPLIVACSSDGTDPVVVDLPLAYIERPLENDEGEVEPDNAAEPQSFRPGAVLYLKQKASLDAQTVDISSAAFADESFLNDDGELLYDVRDLSTSYDGKKLLFSMRAPEIENADEEDQPTWNIWEYNIESSTLRRIFDSTLNVRAEDGHDISPSYLPGDRILFTSTRQTRAKAVLLNEGKTGYPALDEERNVHAFNLHIMDGDGQNIQQLTFNQSHDLDPILLNNGKVLFSRWDNAGQTRNNGVNLYEINPDGTGLNYLYGRHSHDSGEDGDQVQFLKPKELENGNIAVSLRTFESATFAAEPLEINLDEFIDADRAIDGSDAIEGQAQVAIIDGVTSSDEQTINGQYGAFVPLYDGSNRYLVSWSLCRVALIDIDAETDGDQQGQPEYCTEEKLASDTYEAATPLYGLYVYDASDKTLKVVALPSEGNRYDQVMLVTSRPEPEDYVPVELENFGNGLGAIHIRSVYDFDGEDTSPAGLAALANPEVTEPSERPQRFLRIEKAVSIPDENVRDFDNSAFGRSRAQSMREILGYVPIEPDGSVMVTVPANVAFALSVLNEKGQRTSERHQNWLQVAPGELIECNGCHTGASEVPHGRNGAGPEPVNTGAETVGLPFPGTSPAGPDEDTPFGVLMGETMAQAYTENYGIRNLSPDITYTDEWVVPADTDNDISYAYEDLTTPMPIKETCEGTWGLGCRIVVNYETHIHSLWSVPRSRIVDELEEDRTCTSCHSNVDSEGETQVPVEQLDLSNGPSTDDPDHYKSYRELLFNDNEVELVEGILIDRLVDSDQPVLDDEGEPLLDEFDNVIFVQETVPVGPTLNTAGALRSGAFLDLFEAGGSHEGDLTLSELKLISEWLDLGAQYFNDPFAAPIN